MSCAADRILLLPRAGINCTESLKMTIDRGLSQIWKRAGINCTESSGGIPTSGSVGATPATQRPLHPDCASFAIVLLLSCAIATPIATGRSSIAARSSIADAVQKQCGFVRTATGNVQRDTHAVLY